MLQAPHAFLASRQVGSRRELAFYRVHGDLFAYACGIITLGIIAATVWFRLRRHSKNHHAERTRIRLHSGSRQSPRPSGVSLTTPGSTGNWPL